MSTAGVSDIRANSGMALPRVMGAHRGFNYLITMVLFTMLRVLYILWVDKHIFAQCIRIDHCRVGAKMEMAKVKVSILSMLDLLLLRV